VLVDACLQLDPQLPATRTARHWVMSTLGEAGVGGAANQVVELLTAELVGQALLRSPGRITVRASFDGQVARVEVVDDAQDSSDPSAPALAILEALAGSWGVLDDPSTGHTVWVEVETEDDWWA
jgi:hypothetical protein